MPPESPVELAVVLQDLGWLLPRTIGAESDPEHALPASELEVMRLLVRRPGLSVNEIAGELRLQPTNASTAVGSLVRRGLLERERDAGDGRVVRLTPTGRALEHRRAQERHWGDALGEALDALPAREAARLRASAPALRRLAQQIADGKELRRPRAV